MTEFDPNVQSVPQHSWLTGTAPRGGARRLDVQFDVGKLALLRLRSVRSRKAVQAPNRFSVGIASAMVGVCRVHSIHPFCSGVIMRYAKYYKSSNCGATSSNISHALSAL